MIENEPYGESMTQNHLCLQYAHEGLDLPLEKRAPVLIKLLKVLHDYFTKHRIEYWLDGGTLLGSYRDGHIIPWDDDADIRIPSHALHRLLEIVPAHPLANDDCLFIFRRAKYLFWNPIPPADLIPCILVDKRNGVFVDIFLCHEVANRWLKMYWLGPRQKWSYYGIEFHQSTVFPLKLIMLEGNLYPCPNKTKKYLQTFYGDLRPRRTNI
jgi:hypothetical protein